MVEITKFEKEVFNYLNELRESGVTNMFGAGSYLVDEFEISKQEASKLLSKWMDNFDANGYDNLILTD